jgi:tetratricopeptide (TPR) repeat protein
MFLINSPQFFLSRRILSFVRSFLFALCLSACAQPLPTLGRIDFPTSAANPQAQQHFIQGVLLLHSFEYADAREEFQRASAIEPKFAMAYWGEALTFTHPVWVQQDAASAHAALAKLAPTPEARAVFAPTQREKDYLQTVEILYGPGDKISRDVAYSDAMHHLMQKYPDDLEAASLYAVALLGTCQGERDYGTYMRAAAVAEEVFAKNPQHPGAIHYLIHAYDDPIHAPLGLRAARIYGKVAGSASHAQHMPSHIFFALGMWDDAIAANIASIAVADDRIKRKGLTSADRNYHSLLWLEYAYLQEGRADEARQVLSGIDRPAELKHMRAIYAIETGEWDKAPTNIDTSTGDSLSNISVLNVKGLLALAHGQIEEARSAAEQARKLLSARDAPSHGAMPMAKPQVSTDQRLKELMVGQLDAAILFADGKTSDALQTLSRLSSEEDSLTFEFGPPTPLKPTHELYADLLLKAGQPQEARVQFQKALERAPQRRLSLAGLAKCQ